jgi:hypothetical protein
VKTFNAETIENVFQRAKNSRNISFQDPNVLFMGCQSVLVRRAHIVPLTDIGS